MTAKTGRLTQISAIFTGPRWPFPWMIGGAAFH
jgi:hypothetical protein